MKTTVVITILVLSSIFPYSLVQAQQLFDDGALVTVPQDEKLMWAEPTENIDDCQYCQLNEKGLPVGPWIIVYFYISPKVSWGGPAPLRKLWIKDEGVTCIDGRFLGRRYYTYFEIFLDAGSPTGVSARWANLPAPVEELDDFDEDGHIGKVDLKILFENSFPSEEGLGIHNSVTTGVIPEKGRLTTTWGRIKTKTF